MFLKAVREGLSCREAVKNGRRDSAKSGTTIYNSERTGTHQNRLRSAVVYDAKKGAVMNLLAFRKFPEKLPCNLL